MSFLEALSTISYLSVAVNVLFFVAFVFLVSMLWDAYDFRGMPPGPRYASLPIVGNLWNLLNDDFKLTGMKKKFGDVIAVKAGCWKVVSAGSPQALKEILVTKSPDYAGRPPFHSFLIETLGGKGIAFGNPGPSWKLHRKLFMTSMRQYVSNIPLLEARVAEQTTQLLQYFDEQNEQPFNPSDVLMRRVADVICEITFGKYFNSSHPGFDKFIEITNLSFGDAELNYQLSILDLFPLSKYLPFKTYERDQKGTELVLLGTIKDVLDEGKANFDESAPVKDLMGGLLKARAEAEYENEEEKQALLSDDYLICTLYDTVSAGYETTVSTLKWAIVFLVNHPQYQEEIQQQMDEVVGRDRMPSLNDRSQLPRVRAALMETLRVGNVADEAIPHYTLKDTTLCGYRVPKDTVVLPDLESVHLNPECWENPTEFNPNRHLDSEGNLISNPPNWLPFSAGRRVCTGEALAKMKLFLFLSWMLHKYTFAPEQGKAPPSLEAVKGFTQSPKPFKIRAMKRD